MKKNLVCIDTETTGLDKKSDFIIQIAAVKIDSETFETIGTFSSYVIPYKEDFNITEGAQEKHGLSKEFILKNGFYLKSIAAEFINFIDDCDILSYNGNSFDIALIDKDFREIGYPIDWSKYTTIDSFVIESKLNSRKLEDTYKRYTGKTLDGAHDAFNDVKATIEIFKHQLQLIDIKDFESKVISPDNIVSFNSNNQLVFNIGKYRLQDVYKICKEDPMYIKWLFGTGISKTTKKTIQDYYENRKQLQ